MGADHSGAVNLAGRRIVANGLGAFAICQSWGNDPELFSEEGASAYHLIRELATWSTWKGTAEFDVIENRLLPPSGHVTQANGTLMQPLHPVRWNFNINVFSAFNLYVADTRTQRQFRSGDIGFPSLISEENLLYQFPNASIDFVVVVLPAPYFGFPANENLQASRSTEESRLDLDCEAASLDLTFFEQLLSTFAKICPVSATDISKRSGRFLICSGDVHYAYGAQARYKAKRPFETEAPGFGVDMVLIQATASAMKNESDFPPNTFTTILGILEDRVGSVPLPASGLPEPVLIYGYNESGSATEAARKVLSDFAQSEEGRKAADVFRPIPWVVWVRKSTGSVRIDASNVTASFLSRMPEPDWQYQIRFLEDLRTATERNVSSGNKRCFNPGNERG